MTVITRGSRLQHGLHCSFDGGEEVGSLSLQSSVNERVQRSTNMNTRSVRGKGRRGGGECKSSH